MATYKEIQAQIEKLKSQAEQARQKEIAAAVAQVHQIVRDYSLTPEDLGLSSPRGRRAPKSKVAPKYRDPETGATWPVVAARQPG